MKRWYALILMFAIMLSMTACQTSRFGGSITEPPEATVPSEPISDNPLIQAELYRGFVMNGSGTKAIGQYAYIRISKETLKGITVEEYAEFCETVVQGSIYNWVSIICNDGTGLQFTGSNCTIVSYGTINYEGIIEQNIGYIKQTKDGFVYEKTD